MITCKQCDKTLATHCGECHACRESGHDVRCHHWRLGDTRPVRLYAPPLRDRPLLPNVGTIAGEHRGKHG